MTHPAIYGSSDPPGAGTFWHSLVEGIPPSTCCGKRKLHLSDPSNELTSPRPLTVGQLNLRKCYVAAFPQLKSEEARYSPFGGWPRLHVKLRELVEAGLFYLGE
ncbi:hypothetical protein TNCV_3136241 [Trichonephila clavipes]|nr:hypothetical protein TNCV_3136241 [Trichonephila clavipes]